VSPVVGIILIIDDDPGIRGNNAELLELSGYTCAAFADGASALAWCLAHPGQAACAVVDLSMPGLSGTQTFRRMRELEPGLPVIISSGSAEDDQLDDLRAHGLTAVLRKPARGAELIAAVARAVAKR
jgi:CheY-like chemotaxis protein